MARYYDSITTRYGDTYTADNDNTQGFIDSFGTTADIVPPSNVENYRVNNFFPGVGQFSIHGGTVEDVTENFFNDDGASGGLRSSSGATLFNTDTAWTSVTMLQIRDTFGGTIWDNITNATASNYSIIVYFDSNNWAVFPCTGVLNETNRPDGFSRMVVTVGAPTDSAGTLEVGDGSLPPYNTTGDTDISQFWAADGIFVPSTDITYSNDVISVENTVTWDGTIVDGTDGEAIIFNKKIVVKDGASLYGNATAGNHIWFVNCTYEVLGDSGGSNAGQTQRLGPGERGDLANTKGTRTDTITTTKANDTTWNHWNPTLYIDSVDGSSAGVMVAGDWKDGLVIPRSPNTSIIRLYPMVGCDWSDATWNFSQANYSVGHAFELFSQPESTDGFNLINCYGYTGPDQNITYNQYEAINQNADADGNEIVYRIFVTTSDDNTVGSSTNFVNPKVDLTPDGAIWWRHPSTIGCAIVRQRYQREFYTNDAETDGRKDVRVFMDTTFQAADASGTSINPSVGTSTMRIFETDNDGILDSTWDFNDGQNKASEAIWGTDARPIDIPILTLRKDPEQTEVDNNSYVSEEELYTTSVTELSLWGDHYVATNTRNKANNYRTASEAAADNGLYVATDVSTVIENDDPVMQGYSENLNNLTGALDSGSPSFNDIAANYKYGVWLTDLPFTQWSDTVFSGSAFTVNNLTRNKMVLDTSEADNYIYTLAATDEFAVNVPKNSDNHITLDNSGSDTVQEMKVAGLSTAEVDDEIIINGGTLRVDTFTDVRSFAGNAALSGFDSTYSIKEMLITDTAATPGFADVEVKGGRKYVFHNLDADTKIELTYDGDAETDGDAIVLLTGTTPTSTDNIRVKSGESNIEIQKVVEIKLSRGDDTTPSKTHVGANYYRFAATESAVQALTGVPLTTTLFSLNNTDNAYEWTFETGVDNNVYFAAAIDGFEIVRVVTDSQSEVTLTPISSSNLAFDTANYTTWGTLDVAPDANPPQVNPIASATADITMLIDVTGASITPSEATDAKVRTFIRKEFQELPNFMDGVLKNYVPTNIIEWDANNITILDAQNSRLKFNRAQDTANSWRVATTVLDESGNDLFDNQTKSGQTGEQILFTPNVTGAGISQIRTAVNDARDQIVGHADLPAGSTGRNVKETYNQAKGAKNAAYAAG